MTLYSFKGQYPTSLPDRIRLSDGRTRTDSSTFTPEEIIDAGWISVEAPPIVEYPNKLEWSENGWISRAPTELEMYQQWNVVQAECVQRLGSSDYKVIKSLESGVSLNPGLISYRQKLRDIYNNVDNLDPWFIEWPVLIYTEENTL